MSKKQIAKQVSRDVARDVPAVVRNVPSASVVSVKHKKKKDPAAKLARKIAKRQLEVPNLSRRGLSGQLASALFMSCAIDPSRENAVCFPDDSTTIPTGLCYFQETGTFFTTTASTECNFMIFPSLRETLYNITGTLNWGSSWGGTANFYGFNSYGSIVNGSMWTGYRIVGLAIRIKLLQPALTRTGDMAIAMHPGNTLITGATWGLLTTYPGAVVMSFDEISQKGGVVSFFLQLCPNMVRTTTYTAVDEPFDPRDFRPPNSLVTETQPRFQVYCTGLPTSQSGNLPQLQIEIRTVMEFTTTNTVVAGLVGLDHPIRPPGKAMGLLEDLSLVSDQFNGAIDVSQPAGTDDVPVASPQHIMKVLSDDSIKDDTSDYLENLKEGLAPAMNASKVIYDGLKPLGSAALKALPVGELIDDVVENLGGRADSWLRGLASSVVG